MSPKTFCAKCGTELQGIAGAGVFLSVPHSCAPPAVNVPLDTLIEVLRANRGVDE